MNPLLATALLGGAAFGVGELATLRSSCAGAKPWWCKAKSDLANKFAISAPATIKDEYRVLRDRAIASSGANPLDATWPKSGTAGSLRDLCTGWTAAVPVGVPGWTAVNDMATSLADNANFFGPGHGVVGQDCIDTWATIRDLADGADQWKNGIVVGGTDKVAGETVVGRTTDEIAFLSGVAVDSVRKTSDTVIDAVSKAAAAVLPDFPSVGKLLAWGLVIIVGGVVVYELAAPHLARGAA